MTLLWFPLRQLAAAAVCMIIVVAIIACATPSSQAIRTPTPTTVAPAVPGGATAVVRGVVDGDTLDVDVGGTVERLRIIGVDTPEVYGGVDCYGREASAHTKSLVVVGATVTLEKDVSERDSFGRLLRYVYLPDGRMLNEVLVADGYAQVYTYPPDVKYNDRFLAAQRAAREGGRGLWASCGVTPRATVLVTPSPGPTPTRGADCDPSYPGVCIPPSPPDLDCADVPYKNFAVRPPDPHRFDIDGDGFGCQR